VIDESVEMSTSISVIFSSDDTLEAKPCEMVDNSERIEVPALSIGEQGISELKAHDVSAKRWWSWGTFNVIVPQ